MPVPDSYVPAGQTANAHRQQRRWRRRRRRHACTAVGSAPCMARRKQCAPAAARTCRRCCVRLVSTRCRCMRLTALDDALAVGRQDGHVAGPAAQAHIAVLDAIHSTRCAAARCAARNLGGARRAGLQERARRRAGGAHGGAQRCQQQHSCCNTSRLHCGGQRGAGGALCVWAGCRRARALMELLGAGAALVRTNARPVCSGVLGE